jgi:hypothetical protein
MEFLGVLIEAGVRNPSKYFDYTLEEILCGISDKDPDYGMRLPRKGNAFDYTNGEIAQLLYTLREIIDEKSTPRSNRMRRYGLNREVIADLSKKYPTSL